MVALKVDFFLNGNICFNVHMNSFYKCTDFRKRVKERAEYHKNEEMHRAQITFDFYLRI